MKSLYSGEGKSTIQKQFEIRLFFNTLKSILICVLLVVVVVVLIKKGFSLKKVKKFFDEGDETTDKDTPDEIPETEDTPAEAVPGEETPDADEETEDDITLRDYLNYWFYQVKVPEILSSTRNVWEIAEPV